MGSVAVLPLVEIEFRHFTRARQVQRVLASHGKRGRKIPDLLVAAAAEELKLIVLHYDADFDHIAHADRTAIGVDCPRWQRVLMTWARGDVVVARDVSRGKPWIALPKYVVEDRPDLLVTYVPEGAPFSLRSVPAGGTARHMFSRSCATRARGG